ncbi:MAG: hypothetical protein ACI9FB_003148 [Candidatus Azotimanducaceae bacterium]
MLEDDPCPIVKIFANKITAASNSPTFIEKLGRTQGCFALKSNDGTQSLSIVIKGHTISLFSGIRASAKIIIHTPLDHSGSQKTHVENLWRHPIFASHVGCLLEFPKTNWIDSAERFWDKNKDYPSMPRGITLECSDESKAYIIGDNPEATVTGDADSLGAFLTGETVFVQSCMNGTLKSEMSFEHTVVLSDVTLQMLLGER